MKTLNKILAIPLIALGLSSCKTVEEGVIYKTKEYIGKLQYTQPISSEWNEPERTLVVTDSTSFVVKGNSESLELEPGTPCYVCYDKIDKKSVLNFTWEDSNKKFKVYGRQRHF
jgi:hypothetical protein